MALVRGKGGCMNVRKNDFLMELANMNKREISIGEITVHHSLYYLFVRIVSIELLFAVTMGVYWFIAISQVEYINLLAAEKNIMLVAIVLTITKVLVLFGIIVQWAADFYQITTDEVIHKKGIIFQREERFKIGHLGSVKFEQNMLGRVLNFGTIKFYNWVLEKDFILFMIHNPYRYYTILQKLMPQADIEKDVMREQLVEKEKEASAQVVAMA